MVDDIRVDVALLKESLHYLFIGLDLSDLEVNALGRGLDPARDGLKQGLQPGWLLHPQKRRQRVCYEIYFTLKHEGF